MANPDHVAILLRGEHDWDQWRAANPSLVPDLSGLDLQTNFAVLPSDLSGTDLSAVCLTRASVHQVRFDDANLSGANMEGAKFHGCSFQRAKCRGLCARGTSFHDCKLDHAMLSDGPEGGALARPGMGLGSNMIVGGMAIRFESDSNSDFSGSNFYGCTLTHAILRCANLHGIGAIQCDFTNACMEGAFVVGASFQACQLMCLRARRSSFDGSSLTGADLTDADLREATLTRVDLTPQHVSHATDLRFEPRTGLVSVGSQSTSVTPVRLRRALLTNADLSEASLVQVDLTESRLDRARVFGIAAWGLILDGASQSDLVITPPGESVVTVDDLELAQFVYLMLNNQSVRRVIETLTSKVVLLLGRFNDDGMRLLRAVKELLRKRGFVAVVFDWPKPTSRNLTETVKLLAGMARFVVVNITDPSSVPQELQAIAPTSPSLAVQPVFIGPGRDYAMFEDFKAYHWVLPVLRAESVEEAIDILSAHGLDAIESKVASIRSQQPG